MKTIKAYSQDQMDAIEAFLKSFLPSGSGIDADWGIIFKGLKVVCVNSYHQMDEMGGYNGWKDFKFTLTPYTMEWRITGGGRGNQDYLNDLFGNFLWDHKKQIADILNIQLVTARDGDAIRHSLQGWRKTMVETYGHYNQWPWRIKDISQDLNAIDEKIRLLTDRIGEI
jgi:hypothetical protein